MGLIDRSRLGWMDFLRFIAVSLVLIRHVYDATKIELPLVAFGWSGVSLFFIISGYIVGGPVWEKIATRRFDYADFLIDRGLRILPAAVAVLMLAHYLSPNGADISPLTYIQALFFLNYFGESAMPVVGHYWSLAAEQHFYVIAPLAMLYFRPCRAAWAALVAYCIARIVFGTYTPTHWQIDYFVLGIFMYAARDRNMTTGWADLCAAICIYALCSYLFSNMNGLGMAAALVSSSALFIAASRGHKQIQAALGCAPFRALGTLSYSMYLLHPLVIYKSKTVLAWIHLHLKTSPTLEFSSSLLYVFAVTTVSAVVLHLLIERPGLWLRTQYRLFRARRKIDQVAIS